MSTWESTLSHYRAGGAGRVLRVAMERAEMPDWLLHDSCIKILRLERLNERITQWTPRGYTFTAADRDDLRAIAALEGEDGAAYREALFGRFFDGGHHCSVARFGGEIVGYAWLFSDCYQITDDDYRARVLELELGDDARFFGNGYIAPAYRLRGLFPHLVRCTVDAFPRARFYTSVAETNDISLRSHLRLGFREVATVHCSRAMRSPYFWTGRGTRGHHWLGLGRPRVPLSRLDS